MLAVGVPAYRLPRELIRREIAVIEALGVEIRCGVTVGKDVSFEELRRTHAAVLIAVGAKRSRALGLPGEHGPGVLGGVDLLRAVSLGEPLPLGREVVVIGGGNVAYDVARTVVRQIAYDAARTAARLRGDEPRAPRVAREARGDARRHGRDPRGRRRRRRAAERLGAGRDRARRRRAPSRASRSVAACASTTRTAASPRSTTTRPRQTLACDTRPARRRAGAEPLASSPTAARTSRSSAPAGRKSTPQTLATTAPGVFVAGDLAHGTRLLIDAVASGQGGRPLRLPRTSPDARFRPTALTATSRCDRLPPRARVRVDPARRRAASRSPPSGCKHPEAEVETRLHEEQAMREASRCLDCGVTPVFDGTRCVLCGGCVDVCPTLCLKLVAARRARATCAGRRDRRVDCGAGADSRRALAILKDEDRCIRCALCAMRCPVDAITHGARAVRTRRGGPHDDDRRLPARSRLDPEPVARRDFLGLSALWAAGAALALRAARRAAAAARRPCCRRRRRSSRSRCPRRWPPGEAFVPPGRSVAVFRDAEGVYAVSTRLHAPRLHREGRRRGLRVPLPRLALRAGRFRDEGPGAEARCRGCKVARGAGGRTSSTRATTVAAGHEGESMSAASAQPRTALRRFVHNLQAVPRRFRRPRSAAARRPPTARARPSSSATSSSTCTPCARTAGACAGRTTWGLGIVGVVGVPDHAGHRRPADVLLQAVSRTPPTTRSRTSTSSSPRAGSSATSTAGRRNVMVVAVILHMARVFYTAAYRAPREFNWLIGMGLLVVDARACPSPATCCRGTSSPTGRSRSAPTSRSRRAR